MRRWIYMATLLALLGHIPALAGPGLDSLALDEKKAAALERTFGLLRSDLTAEDVQFLKSQAQPGNEPINVLATVVLYKADSAAYRDLLFEYFSVRDYVERARGRQNFISQQHFVSVVGKIEQQIGEELVKQNLMHLFGYWYFRDRNEWFMVKDQTISAARFFRTSSLSAYLGLPEDRVMALATAIDEATQKSQLEDE
jgi:hypothetical protein